MMKRIGISSAILLVIFVVSSAMAFDLLPGKNKADKANVDVNSLSTRSASLLSRVQAATASFGEGIVLVMQAVGKKEDAEKLQQSINNMKENKGDINATKDCTGKVNNAVAEMKDIDLASQMNKEQAQAHLGDSILKIGIGGILDGYAVKDASVLLQESQAALKQVSWTTVGKVKSVINVAQFVVQEIPPQANNLNQYSGKLVAYAKTVGIKVNPETIKKQAEAKMAEN